MFNLYIGANNETGQVETDKIVRIVGKQYRSYTIIEAMGYWLDKPEKMVIVQIQPESSVEIIDELIQELKKALKQEAIGFQITPPLTLR